MGLTNLFTKFISFFRRNAPDLQEIIDSSIPRYQVEQEGNIFDSPFVVWIVKPIKLFWSKHWQWIIGIIVSTILAIIGLYIAWLSVINPK